MEMLSEERYLFFHKAIGVSAHVSHLQISGDISAAFTVSSIYFSGHLLSLSLVVNAYSSHSVQGHTILIQN